MKLRISKNLIVLVAIILSFIVTNNVSAANGFYWNNSAISASNSLPNDYNQQSCYINSFSSSSTQINQNSSVTLRWNTSGCDRVYISNLGNVAPSAQTTFFPTQTMTYTLKVYDSNGLSDTKDIKIYVVGNSVNLNNQDSFVSQNGNPIINNNYYSTTPKVSTTASTTSTTSANNVSTNTTKTSATNSTNNSTVTKASVDSTNNLGASAGNAQTSGNNLTALSLKGSGGFMPSSIWQWILVVILILVIIIIARTLATKPTPEHEAHLAPHAH